MTDRATVTARRASRRRGSVYLATLGAAMIVTVIGLSALLLARVQHRGLGGTEDAAAARCYAQSAVDLALFRLSQNSNWRDIYTNDAWTAEQTAGEVTFCHKVVDEGDGDLDDDPSEPVRLYAKATVRQAVRISSVLARPGEPNLLANADMESGTTAWTGLGWCDLESHTDDPHSGLAYIWVKNRSWPWSGPHQDVRGKIAAGVPYQTEVWIRMKDAPETVRIRLFVNSSGQGDLWFSSAPAVAGTAWTKVAGTVTPTWTGTLNSAYWKIDTASTPQEFKIDDALLGEGGGPPMTIVPGSWRQEVLP